MHASADMQGFTPRVLTTAEGPIELFERPGTQFGTVVLLHGIQGTADAWAGVAAALSTGQTVLCPNLRGRGGSLSPEDPAHYTLPAFARDLHAVVEQAEPPILLLGWSMGVLVALTYIAERRDDAIDALVLASGTACPGVDAVWFEGKDADAIAEEAVGRAERLALRTSATPSAVAGAWMSVREADLRNVLPGIRVPTLVLHGEADDQCPAAHGEAIARAVPKARFDLWRGGGHNLMAEAPGRFARTIGGFAAQRLPYALAANN